MGIRTLVLVFAAAPLAFGQELASSTPPTPSGLTATATSSSQINLGWSGTFSGGTFRIERKLESGSFAEIASVASTVTTYANTGLLDDSRYAYRVRARKGGKNSAYSNEASAVTPAANAWRALNGDVRHTGKNALESGTAPLTPAWTVNLSPPGFFVELLPPVIENGRVFAAMNRNTVSQPCVLSAVNLSNGTLAWTSTLGSMVGAPAVRHGRVFLTEGDFAASSLKALNASTGATLWSAPVPPGGYFAPIAAGETVYGYAGVTSGGLDGSLYGFKTATGASVFLDTAIEPGTGGSPALDGNNLYTFIAGNLRNHDPATGVDRWTVGLPTGPGMTPVLGNGLVFVVSGGAVHAVNPATRTIAWSSSGHWILPHTPAFADGVLYVNNAGTILGLDAQSGAPVWTFAEDLNIEFAPVIVNNHLFVSSRNDMWGVNLTTRQVVWHETNTWGGWLAAAGGKLVVARITGELSAYSFTAGTLPVETAVPAAPASPTAVAAGPGRVDLSWTDASNNESAFRVERSRDNGFTFQTRTILGAGATSFSDSGLLAGLTYQYRVRAFNAAGTSAASSAVSAVAAGPGNFWSTGGHDAQHTGFNAQETGKTPLTLAWSKAMSGPVKPVAVEGGRVFASSATLPGAKSELLAMDVETGATLWTHGFYGAQATAPAVAQGRVVYQFPMSPSGRVFGLNAATGKPEYAESYSTQWSDQPQAVVHDGQLFNGSGYYGFEFEARSAEDGARFWTALNAYIPAARGQEVYTHMYGQLRSLDRNTGADLWTMPISNGSIPVLSAARLYVLRDRDLQCVDPATRTVKWTVLSGNTNNLYAEPAVNGGFAYWVSEGRLLKVRESDGAVIWTFAGGDQLRYAPAIAGNTIYVGGLTTMHILRLDGTAVGTRAFGGPTAVAAGKVFLSGLDGTLRAYRMTP